MNWNSWHEFLHMGGYGLYVWGSYLVCLALLVLEGWLSARRHAQALRAPELEEDEE